MSLPLTVIMPVRNGERYLEEALCSLCAQTDRRFSVLVWDDGSEDATAEILNRWLPTRLPGRVLGHEPIGIGKALARLVDSAPSPMIARMDADDRCDAKRFELQLNTLTQRPDLAVLGTQMRRFSAEHGEQAACTQHPCNDADLRWAMRLGNPLNHPTVMMRRQAVLDCGNYRDLRPGQDDDLWLRIARRYRIENLGESLLDYREHSASITANDARGVQTFRERRITQAELVFPGIDQADARRLTHLLTHPDALGVTRRDLAAFNRTAVSLAKQSGEPGDYFTRTALYQSQRKNLAVRLLKTNTVVRKAWPAGKWVKHKMSQKINNDFSEGGSPWATRA